MKSKQQRKADAAANHRNDTPTLDNRRARHEYEFLESLEAGLVLTGTEIKSIRAGGASLNESYARVRDGEAWLMGMHVSGYKEGSFSNVEPNRPRKLLLHREQIEHLRSRVGEKGLTIVPLRMYFTRGKVKVQLGLARGKKLWDKRADIAKRDVERDIARQGAVRGNHPERALIDAILREGIVRSGERITIACSGGPDSIALAWAMAGAAHELHLQLQLAYVDHARRASSLQDECVVAAASATLGLPLVAVSLDGNAQSEAQLRDARYAALQRTARAFGATAIATAHHAEDQSETVLLALFRGTGSAGLSGMPARRTLEPGIDLVRPLLRRSAKELLDFCHEAAAPYAVDPTNADSGIARNGVREALTALRPLFPQLDRAVARAAALAADEAGDAPRAGLRKLVRERVAGECGLLDVPFEHVEAAVRAMERGASGRFHLKPGIELEVQDGAIAAIRAR